MTSLNNYGLSSLPSLDQLDAEIHRRGLGLIDFQLAPEWFHSGQMEGWTAEELILLLLCGHQSGKTTYGCRAIAREIQRCGFGDYALVGPSITLMEAKVLPLFKALFETQHELGKLTTHPYRFKFSQNGLLKMFGSLDKVKLTEEHGADYLPMDLEVPLSCTVYFGYGSDPDTLESATYKAALTDEAGQHKFKRESHEALTRRLNVARGRKQSKKYACEHLSQGREIHCTTPYEFNWLKTEINDQYGVDPRIGKISFESISNPVFSRAVWDVQRKIMPPWKFDMFYRGRYTRPAGSIYECFDDDRNVLTLDSFKALFA